MYKNTIKVIITLTIVTIKLMIKLMIKSKNLYASTYTIYFTNQTVCVFIYTIIIVYLLSRYILPESFRNTITRQFFF